MVSALDAAPHLGMGKRLAWKKKQQIEHDTLISSGDLQLELPQSELQVAIGNQHFALHDSRSEDDYKRH